MAKPDKRPLSHGPGRAPSSCSHKFAEQYYGYECELCGLFYAFGTAPWEYDFEAEEAISFDSSPELE